MTIYKATSAGTFPMDAQEEAAFLAQQAIDSQPSPDVVSLAVTNAVQARLDNYAKSRGYDHIVSMCSYDSSSVPRFKADGADGVKARDQAWAKCIEIQQAVIDGGPLPTVEQVIAQLPALP